LTNAATLARQNSNEIIQVHSIEFIDFKAIKAVLFFEEMNNFKLTRKAKRNEKESFKYVLL